MARTCLGSSAKVHFNGKDYVLRRIVIATLLGLLAAGGVGAQEAALAPAPAKPRMVIVSVKIVEFQAEKGVDTGLTAYFLRRNKQRDYGRISSGNGAVRMADVTFPILDPAITVFLDRIGLSEGDMEITLQALVNESRAFILSRPKVMVKVGSKEATVSPPPEEDPPKEASYGATISMTQMVPYEKTVVVGATAVQTTAMLETGVILNATVPDVYDYDGDWETFEDQYIELNVEVSVDQLGAYLVVTLDDQLVGDTDNRIFAPEIISRKIKTTVIVRHGQVLMLGGMYRNTKSRSSASLPGLATAEGRLVGLAERVIPGEFLFSPLSSTLGSRSTSESRRELVFFIKAESQPSSYTVQDHQFLDVEEEEERRVRPADVISDMIEGLQDITEGITGEGDTDKIRDTLGGNE